MGSLDGRVAIVTGAGRGLGREHALLLAAEGAAVVVNDVGAGTDGAGTTATPAEQVVEEILQAGGKASANADDIAEEAGAEAVVQQALEQHGGLHVLVNNAGILRDRTIVSMTTDEWDDVVRVHLRGHFLPTRAAARWWRAQSKEGTPVAASVINTASTSGLFANPGQANYGAAKSGIATFTQIAQAELGRYGVRCNAICPAGRTRLSLSAPGMEEALAPPESGFDKNDPANVSPFVGYLATESCPIAGRVFFVYGGEVHLIQPWTAVAAISSDERWTVTGLAGAAAHLADVELDVNVPF